MHNYNHIHLSITHISLFHSLIQEYVSIHKPDKYAAEPLLNSKVVYKNMFQFLWQLIHQQYHEMGRETTTRMKEGLTELSDKLVNMEYA